MLEIIFKFSFIYLRDRGIQTQTESSHLLAQSSNVPIVQYWVRLKLGAKNTFQISHMGSRSQATWTVTDVFSGYTLGRSQNQKLEVGIEHRQSDMS